MRFTCDGDEVSPPLRWSGVPEQAEELVLLVEDPDASGGTFVHWTVFGIDPKTTGFPEGGVSGGGRIGENAFGKQRWGGPCPPRGDEPHRYVFLLYAVVNETGFGAGAVPDYVRDRIDNKGVLTRGRLTGVFSR